MEQTSVDIDINVEQDVGDCKREKQILAEAGKDDQTQWPALTVETATPSPHSPQTPDINNNEEDEKSASLKLNIPQDNSTKEEDDEDGEEGSDEGGEEEEVEEEEEEDPEMTPEEKRDMHECVKSGDIDSLEDCLDLPNADINMTWFRENLLMTAIRYGQIEMAMFLLDNGIDHTYSTSIVGMRETSKGKFMDRFQLNCRQMAYDKELADIVDLIDSLQGNLFPFVRLPDRTVRLRRPRPLTPSQPETESDDSSSEGADISSTTDSDGEEKADDTGDGRREERERKRQMLKKLKKKAKKKQSIGTVETTGGVSKDADGLDDGDGERDKTIGGGSSIADVDSGHHSMGSSKLKMALLREHDRLMEREDEDQEDRLKKDVASKGGGSSSKGGTVNKRQLSTRDVMDANGSVRSQARESGARSDTVGEQIQDEGYGGSASPESRLSAAWPPSAPPLEPAKPWEAPPKNRIRSTKSALTLRGSRCLRENRRILSGGAKLPQRYAISGYSSVLPITVGENSDDDNEKENKSDSPLRWRKVSTAGSYTRESRQWHVAPKDLSKTSTMSVEISEIQLGIPHTASSTTLSQSSAATNTATTSSSSIGLPRSIMKPTTSVSTLSSVFSNNEHQSRAQDSSVSPKSGEIVTSNGKPPTGASAPRKTVQAPGYMRATQSTASKCRLSPCFASSYGALSFQAGVPALADQIGQSRQGMAKFLNGKHEVTSNGNAQKEYQTEQSLKTTEVSPKMAQNAATTLIPMSRNKILSDTKDVNMVNSNSKSWTSGKNYNIPVLHSPSEHHQKRNLHSISFRS